MGFRDRNDQAAQDRETIIRVRERLTAYQQTGGGKDVSVNIPHVLDLLNPRGLWTLDPVKRRDLETPKDQPQGRSPTADPITGCEPVTAPGAGPVQPGR